MICVWDRRSQMLFNHLISVRSYIVLQRINTLKCIQYVLHELINLLVLPPVEFALYVYRLFNPFVCGCLCENFVPNSCLVGIRFWSAHNYVWRSCTVHSAPISSLFLSLLSLSHKLSVYLHAGRMVVLSIMNMFLPIKRFIRPLFPKSIKKYLHSFDDHSLICCCCCLIFFYSLIFIRTLNA